MKPEIMDGVPEEPGFYFLYEKPRASLRERFYLFRVETNIDTGDLFAVNVINEGPHRRYNENHFDDYTWSEKIEPPEVDSVE